MFRVLAGVIAMIAGLATGMAMLWMMFGGPSRVDALGWAVALSIFYLPVLFWVIPFTLAALELAARSLKAPRLALLALATLLVSQLGFVAFVMNKDDAGVLNLIMQFGATLVAPCLVACAVHVAMASLPALLAPHPPRAKPPKPPRKPSPFAPVVLKAAPDSERLVEILTSPNARINQQLFMYALQTWARAAGIWFVLPLLGGALLGLPQDLRLIVAAAGWIMLLWSAFCVTANRLHDLGLRGAWAITPLVAGLAWVLSEGPPQQGWLSMTGLVHLIIAGVVCYGLAAAVLLTRPGEPWSNNYGPAPD